MKFMTILAAAMTIAFSLPAEARHRHHHYRQVTALDPVIITCNQYGCDDRPQYRGHVEPVVEARPVRHPRPLRHLVNIDGGSVVGGRPAGCPSAFCGCGTSLHIFGRIIPALNLAANWFRFPHAAPAPGMVAVRNHHVFAIERVIDEHTVVAYDSNSGRHLTRVHIVSLRGYSVRDPRG